MVQILEQGHGESKTNANWKGTGNRSVGEGVHGKETETRRVSRQQLVPSACCLTGQQFSTLVPVHEPTMHPLSPEVT